MNADNESLSDQVIQFWFQQNQKPHGSNCWRSHPECTIMILAAEIQKLEKIIAEKNETINKILQKFNIKEATALSSPKPRDVWEKPFAYGHGYNE